MDRLPQLFSRAPAETLIQSSGKKPPVKLTLPIDPIGSTSASTDVPIVNAAQTNTARSELLLVCEARSTTLSDGSWRFSLESANGTPIFDAEDQEMGDLNRLTLLAAVRGLEAIEGPSSVTLISNNRYLIRSLSDSLPRWRQNGFMWEHFGRRVDVQNADLWRRVDRALQIHRVEACLVSTRLVSPGQDVVAETPAGTVQHAWTARTPTGLADLSLHRKCAVRNPALRKKRTSRTIRQVAIAFGHGYLAVRTARCLCSDGSQQRTCFSEPNRCLQSAAPSQRLNQRYRFSRRRSLFKQHFQSHF